MSNATIVCHWLRMTTSNDDDDDDDHTILKETVLMMSSTMYCTKGRGMKARSWSWSWKPRSWSWSCCSGLVLKILVLFTSLVITSCHCVPLEQYIATIILSITRSCTPVVPTQQTMESEPLNDVACL